VSIMSDTRSSEKFYTDEKMKENVLPTNEEVLQHYYFKMNLFQHTCVEFMAKAPEFHDLQNEVVTDITNLW